MAISVMSWVLDHSRTKNGARLVLIAIANCANSSGEHAWPSNAEIRRLTNLGERAVREGIATCVDLGELEVSYNAGPGGANRYRVIMGSGSRGAGTTGPPADSAPGTICPPAESAPRHIMPGHVDNSASPQVSDDPPPTPAHNAPRHIMPAPPAQFAPVTVLEPSKDHHHPRDPEPPGTPPGQPDDDDDLVRAVIETLAARTGRPLDVTAARHVIAAILNGRTPRNPVAYIRRALEAEPNPLDRFGLRSLPAAGPAAGPARPPKCGGCNPFRRIEDPDTGADLGPCPVCSANAPRDITLEAS